MPPAPVREPTVAELAERYMRGHVEVNCRSKSAITLGRAVQLYIVPELGHLRLSEADRSHAAALLDKMRGTPYQANRTVDVLAKMFRLAEAWGMTGPRPNPCRSVWYYKEHPHERFLTPEEYRRLGRVLDEAQAGGGALPAAVAAIRLLLLTGCRKNEILTLRWDDIDRAAGELRLRDAKTGTRQVPLTPAVDWVLAGTPRIKGNPWVTAGRTPGDRLKNMDAIMSARCGNSSRSENFEVCFFSRLWSLDRLLSKISVGFGWPGLIWLSGFNAKCPVSASGGLD